MSLNTRIGNDIHLTVAFELQLEPENVILVVRGRGGRREGRRREEEREEEGRK